MTTEEAINKLITDASESAAKAAHCENDIVVQHTWLTACTAHSVLAIALMLRELMDHRCECGREVYNNPCGKCDVG